MRLAPACMIAVATSAMFVVCLVLVAVEVPQFAPAFRRRRTAGADSPVVAIFALAFPFSAVLVAAAEIQAPTSPLMTGAAAHGAADARAAVAAAAAPLGWLSGWP